ncbi:MAG: glycoside hydrolase family 92 protein, partial [Bacteroidaceae bacterium]|nr:glycoside hydrolase family 92 protein [Bacteroidaceae bacterium]
FVFASLGLYPLVVGEPQYELFSPLFDCAELRLGDGGMTKTVIRTSGRRDAKQPLRRVTWNGRRLRDFRIQHSELVKGGELVFWY